MAEEHDLLPYASFQPPFLRKNIQKPLAHYEKRYKNATKNVMPPMPLPPVVVCSPTVVVADIFLLALCKINPNSSSS
jgi:hypothetical protein